MKYFCYCKKCGFSGVPSPSKLGMLLCEKCGFIMQPTEITEEDWNSKNSEEKASIRKNYEDKYKAYVYYRISDKKFDYALMKDEQNLVCTSIEKFFCIGYSVNEWESFSKQKQNELLNRITEEKTKEAQAIQKRNYELKYALQIKMANHMLTTGYNFEGYKITQYLGIVCGEAVVGTGLFSSTESGLADLFGGESTTYSSKLQEAREAAKSRAIKQSVLL